MKHPVDRQIDEAFLAHGDYPNFGKERGMVKKARQLSERDCPEDPGGKADAMVKAFQWMIDRSGEMFWQEQPFLPSRLVRYWRDIEKKMEVVVERENEPFGKDPWTGEVYQTEADFRARKRR